VLTGARGDGGRDGTWEARTVTVSESHLNGLYAAKPRFQRRLDRLATWLAKRGVHPDVVTYAGLGCAALGGVALAFGLEHTVWLWTVPVLVALRLTCNALDGMIATRAGLARPWGKVLNELCDRLADLAFLAPLLLVPATNVSIVCAALLATLLVSYLGVLAEAAGASREYGGFMGKADRMLWLGLAAAISVASGDLLVLRLLPVFLLGGAVLTLVQRGGRIHAAL
jgi:CDP-diacylglycerol--glycerol-3-phosphate 3-phosphatidyltransferase